MTQPAGIEVTNPSAYQNQIIGLLGERDPLNVLRAGPDTFARLIDPVPLEKLRRRPYADRWTWTPLEILGHLCDTEMVFAFRIRLILSEERPVITSMDQDKWVAAQKYNERNPQELLAEFRALRGINIGLWETIAPADLARVGLHAERGIESLSLMQKMEAGHDLSHVGQIQRYLAAIG